MSNSIVIITNSCYAASPPGNLLLLDKSFTSLWNLTIIPGQLRLSQRLRQNVSSWNTILLHCEVILFQGNITSML